MEFFEEDAFVANLIMADLEEAEIANAEGRSRRVFESQDALELPENQFIKLFRLSKNLVRYVLEIITSYLSVPSRRSALTLEKKLLIALFFYGHGSYQENVGKTLFTAVSQGCVSQCLKEITKALNRAEIMNRFIHFPKNLQELKELRNRFAVEYAFPGAIGCIDCTHVAIVRPKEDEHIFVNRKSYHSLNVQLICDEKYKIMNVNARYPGSTHDASIWRDSAVNRTMQEIFRRYKDTFFLLGDSGYPLRPWLIIPIQNVEPNSPEEHFNNRHCSVRSIIERCNGILKNRFRCLLKHRVLHYSPEVAGQIVNACVILHNICVENNIEEPENDDLNNIDFGICLPPNNINDNQRNNPDLQAGRFVREQIITQHFRY